MEDSKMSLIEGRALAVRGDDIDTDRIMPARYLRCVTFADIGQHVFQDERFDPAGQPKPHPFNDAARAGAVVLVVNKNFGCGSSREHAPQGLKRWGLRAVVGESFAEIFAGNCAAIGLPALTAKAPDIERLMAAVDAHPDATVAVDIEKGDVRWPGGVAPIAISPAQRQMFLEGTWDSSATLRAAGDRIGLTAQKIPYLNWSLLDT